MGVGTIGCGAGAHAPTVMVRNNVLSKDDDDDGESHLEDEK